MMGVPSDGTIREGLTLIDTVVGAGSGARSVQVCVGPAPGGVEHKAGFAIYDSRFGWAVPIMLTQQGCLALADALTRAAATFPNTPEA